VQDWNGHASTVTGSDRIGSGALAIADPRQGCDARDSQHRRFNNCFRVVAWERAAQAVTGGSGPSAGGQAVADPRTAARVGGDWSGSQHYGVVPWGSQSGAIVGAARHDNGAFSVADPRVPDAGDRLVAVIRSLDNTWHRPFTTLELAALQGLVTPDELVELEGESHSAWRERIGNAVPVQAAAAVASEMGRAILLARSGETFALGSTPISARELAIALSVQTPTAAEEAAS